MTNPILSNKISSDSAILWQYDKAPNLIHLIQNWNEFATVSCERFWNYIGNKVLPIDAADEYGLTIWGGILGIARPSIRVPLPDEADANDDSSDGKPYAKTAIGDDFYRRILKARFFMMNHSPTVPNYNKFLAILFGAIDSTSNQIEYDTIKIFDDEGNVTSGYTARSRVLDWQDMTMGFTFPIEATDEEAYMIFQHYDTLYPFPAGIRYPGEFIDDELVIGLNTDGAGVTGSNQNYKNFVDGLVLAESDEGNQNGGIFSSTDRANYLTASQISGVAYVMPVTEDDSDVASAALKVTNTTALPQKVWVDWGNGECVYHYLKANAQEVALKPTRGYDFNGLVAIKVFYPEGAITVTDPAGAQKKYKIFPAS